MQKDDDWQSEIETALLLSKVSENLDGLQRRLERNFLAGIINQVALRRIRDDGL
jgi:hypothetical protein